MKTNRPINQQQQPPPQPHFTTRNLNHRRTHHHHLHHHHHRPHHQHHHRQAAQQSLLQQHHHAPVNRGLPFMQVQQQQQQTPALSSQLTIRPIQAQAPTSAHHQAIDFNVSNNIATISPRSTSTSAATYSSPIKSNHHRSSPPTLIKIRVDNASRVVKLNITRLNANCRLCLAFIRYLNEQNYKIPSNIPIYI